MPNGLNIHSDERTTFQLNDFIFCPADSATYSTQKGMLQGISVYCEKYNLVWKIDVFDEKQVF